MGTAELLTAEPYRADNHMGKQQRINRRSRQFFVASVLSFVLYRSGRARWIDVHRHAIRLGHRAGVENWGSDEAAQLLEMIVEEGLLVEEKNPLGFRVWLTVPGHESRRGTSSSPK